MKLKIDYKKLCKGLYYQHQTLAYLNSFGNTWVACTASSQRLEKCDSILQAVFINFKNHSVLHSYFLPSGLHWVCQHLPRSRLDFSLGGFFQQIRFPKEVPRWEVSHDFWPGFQSCCWQQVHAERAEKGIWCPGKTTSSCQRIEGRKELLGCNTE